MTLDPAPQPTFDAARPAAGTMVWEQQPGEPNAWYDRFHEFLMMGRTRNVQAVYVTEARRARARKGAPVAEVSNWSPRTLPHSWGRQVAAWAWRERAAAWDAYQRQIEDEEFDAERRQDRRNRINVNRGLRGWGVQNLSYLPSGPVRCATCDHATKEHNGRCLAEGCTCSQYVPTELPDPGDVIRAIQTSTQELRKEYGDEPAQRHEHTGRVANVELQVTPNDLANKTDEELEADIGLYSALLSHLTPGTSGGASPTPPGPAAPDDPGRQEPPLDEP